MSDDPYEIIPHQLLADLRQEVEDLKDKLQEPDNVAKELIIEMGTLKDSINELHTVFEKALDVSSEEQDTTDLKNKLSSIISQNEVIARGMIAISDRVDKFIKDQDKPVQQTNRVMPPPSMGTVKHTMGMPNMIGRQAPSFERISDSSMNGMPPPPPPPPGSVKKKGLFG